MPTIDRIALAIAFSPTAPSMLAEAFLLARNFNAQLYLIHVSKKSKGDEQGKLEGLIKQTASYGVTPQLIFEEGDPADKILQVCRKMHIDLLVAGALKKEKLLKYYIGTIARKIMRKTDCSLLVITNPSIPPQPIRSIVVNAEDSPFVEDALAMACQLAPTDLLPWIHVVREIKLYGLAMASFDQQSEEEYSEVRHNLLRQEAEQVEKLLGNIPHQHCKINIKMLSGKSGFELVKFTNSKNAHLLVVGAPKQKFKLFDRVFTHDLEYVFADLPCNLLIVHSRKEVTNE
jgi:nucleotide-binding universal stress UspA family protein